MQEIYRPSEMYKLAAKTKNIINDELLKTLNEEQKDLLEQWQYCEDRILDDMVEQAFVYGYATAVELREEAIKQYEQYIKDETLSLTITKGEAKELVKINDYDMYISITKNN